MTREFALLAEAFGYGLEDVRWFTVNAMKSAFLPFDERLALIDDVIKPGYAALLATLSGVLRGADGEGLQDEAEAEALVRPAGSGVVVGDGQARLG